MKDLKNKIIIVTGSQGLIGRYVVERLEEFEATVVKVDINFEKKGGNQYKIDLTTTVGVDQLLESVLEKFGKIDGLVNNAYPRTADWGVKFEDIELASWNLNFEMQMGSLFYLLKKVLLIMKGQKAGSVVNVSSIYGVVGNDFNVYKNTGGMTSPAAYSAIKGGLINFSRYLASYYGPHGIRVNCVSPGGVFNHQNETFVKQFEEQVPMNRMAQPHEIAPSVCFLLSEQASYVTGHNLMVDGGWTAI